jgi:hypothetical protein
MNNPSKSDLNDSPKIWKQIWQLSNKHLVIIDESIIQELGINDNLITFVEQKLTQDGILLIIKNF